MQNKFCKTSFCNNFFFIKLITDQCIVSFFLGNAFNDENLLASIVLASKYLPFLGQGKGGFNHGLWSLFTTFSRLVFRLWSFETCHKINCTTFGIKILKIASIILLWQTFCKIAFEISKHYFTKGTNLDHERFVKFLLFYIFTDHWFSKFWKLMK